MKIKTSELTGAALDWAVSEALGLDWDHPDYGESRAAYSTDWSQGGPIIEREEICLSSPFEIEGVGRRNDWGAKIRDVASQIGETPLIAAMRCYVASKLGDEIEVPEELVK